MSTRSYTGKAAEILDAAERRMRCGGFDAVSFRDLAAEVGIKSASVHYYFPQKADLGVAVVDRYADRFLKSLGPPDDPADIVTMRIARLCATYRSAVIDDGRICLCCILGGEALDLPPPVSAAVGRSFTRILDWTARALKAGQPGSDDSPLNAAHIVASLQGAMILAIATKQPEHFIDIEKRLLRMVRSRSADV